MYLELAPWLQTRIWFAASSMPTWRFFLTRGRSQRWLGFKYWPLTLCSLFFPSNQLHKISTGNAAFKCPPSPGSEPLTNCFDNIIEFAKLVPGFNSVNLCHYFFQNEIFIHVYLSLSLCDKVDQFNMRKMIDYSLSTAPKGSSIEEPREFLNIGSNKNITFY